MADFAPPPVPAAGETPYLAPAATPEASGAGVGEALAQGAGTVQQGLMQANEILLHNNYDADMSAAQVKLAKLRDSMNQHLAALQGDPNLAPQDYHDAALGAFDTLAPQVSDGIANTRIARQINAQVSEMRDQFSEQATGYQAAGIARQATAQTSMAFNSLYGQLAQTRDPAEAQKILEQGATIPFSMKGINQDTAQALSTEFVQHGVQNFAYGLTYSDNAQDVGLAKQLLQNGAFASMGLRGDEEHILLRAVDGRLGRLQAQANAQQQAAIASFAVGGNQTLATINAGGSVPLPQLVAQAQQARAMAQAAEAAGKPRPELEALANNLDKAAVQQDVNGRFGSSGLTTVQNAARDAMAAISAAKAAGKPVSFEDGAHAEALQELSQRLTSQANRDPMSLASNYGIQLAPLDPSNPASYGQRAMQSQVVQRTAQIPQPIGPLTADEAQQRQKLAASSDQGRMQVLGELDHFDPAHRALAATQIMPGDGAFVAEAQLNPGDRGMVQAGRERLKANPQFWDAKPQGTIGPPPAKVLLGQIGANIDNAMGPGISQSDIAGIKTTVQNYLAGYATGQSHSDGLSLNSGDASRAVSIAMGGHALPNGQWTGGLGWWGQVAAGRSFVLPSSMTSSQFGSAVVARAAQDAAAGRGPVNPNGTTFNLSQAKPVYIGNGTYRWQTQSGTVMKRGGGQYLTQIGG